MPRKINHRDPVFVCRPKPLVVGGVRVIPHKGIVDRVVAFEDLAVNFPLIVVPDPSAGARKHRPDREQVTHAPRLEDPALRVHKGYSLVVEFEPGAQLLLCEVIMHFAQEPDALECGEAHQDVGVVGAHAVVLISGKYPFPGPQAYRQRQIPVCQEKKCPRLATFGCAASSAFGCRRRILSRRASNCPGEVEHAIQIRPQIQRLLDELRSLVHRDELGIAIRGGDPLQAISHVQTAALCRTSVAKPRRLKVLMIVRTRIRRQPDHQSQQLGAFTSAEMGSITSAVTLWS